MNCERCGKRLSRKTARQIDGVVMCSPCMMPELKGGLPRKSGETRRGETRDSGSGPKGENSRSEVEGEAPQSGLSASEGIAQPLPQPLSVG